jgi:hypothetical protein
MAFIVSLGFPYKGDNRRVLIASKQLNEKVQYRITIMDGELEKLLADCNIIDEENGALLLDDCNGNIQKLELKKEIVKALAEHMHKEIRPKYRQNN